MYWKIVGIIFSAFILTMCVSSSGEFCLWGMRSGTSYGETTWGTADRVALTPSELKKYTKISQQKVNAYVDEIYDVADLYCVNRQGFYPDEKLKNRVRELATIYVNGVYSVSQIQDLRLALKEDDTSLMFARVLETAGLYKDQMLDYCDHKKRVDVPTELQKTLFYHYMNNNGLIWFDPERSARVCKSVLG